MPLTLIELKTLNYGTGVNVSVNGFVCLPVSILFLNSEPGCSGERLGLSFKVSYEPELDKQYFEWMDSKCISCVELAYSLRACGFFFLRGFGFPSRFEKHTW